MPKRGRASRATLGSLAPRPPHRRSALACCVGAASLVLGALFPVAGLAGAIAIALARRVPPSLGSRAARALGAASVATVVGWAAVLSWPARPIARGESPRVVSSEPGEGAVSVVAGSLFPWSERTDAVRVAAPAAGAFGVRIVADADATIHLDRASAIVVDHAPGHTIVPAEGGALYTVTAVSPPRAARAGDGRDVTELVASVDGRAAPPTSRRGADGEPVDALDVDLSRPAGARLAVLVTARTTPFAEEAFARYVARMGQGMTLLMSRVTKEDCTERCRREVWDDEIGRLRVPLSVTLTRDGAPPESTSLAPLGSASMRTVAVPVDVGSAVSLRVSLSWTPRFWEIDRVALAVLGDPPEVRPVAAAQVVTSRGPAPAKLVEIDDRRRVTIDPGAEAALAFALPPPPPPPAERAVFVRVRAYYTVPTGGHWGLDPAFIFAHRSGLTSLPRFAESLSGAR